MNRATAAVAESRSWRATSARLRGWAAFARVRLDNLRAAVARRDGDVVTWRARLVQLRGNYVCLSRDGHAGDAAREGAGRRLPQPPRLASRAICEPLA
jgi:hypothetical protein